MKKYYYLIFTVVAVAIISLLPHFYSIYLAGDQWQGILPEYTNDGLYYYARMSDVGKGNIFLGNPYLLEHRAEPAPAFFVADWLASWPLFLGLSLELTVYLNNLLWPLLLFLSLIIFFTEIGLTRRSAMIGSLVGYLSVFSLMARPVVMQVIFPFYILFLVAIVRQLKGSREKINLFFLTFFYTLSFYLYPYLWQISVVTILLLTGWRLIKRQWPDFFYLASINLATLVLISPIIWYTYLQISSPFYWETMVRLGLVKTHLPTLLAIFDSVVVIIGLLTLSVFYRLIVRRENNSPTDWVALFFTLTGSALIIVNLSNIITGQEIEISNHIGRFIDLWLALLVIHLIFSIKRHFSDFYRLSRRIQWFIGGLTVIFVIILSPRIASSFFSLTQPLAGISESRTKDLQSIAGPLTWLEQNVPPGSVIWANKLVSSYVPIRTHHYVLSSPQGGLHTMSSAELVERYLISGYFRDLTLADIKNDFRSYAGVGNAIHQYRTNNRRVKLCYLLLLNRIGYSCGQPKDSFSWRGEEYFSNLYQQYLTDIKPNINEKLAKYQVSYILLDHQNDELKLPVTGISGLESVYQDSRFELYRIKPL